MNQPWGLSGPEFLNVYWIALGVALLFAIMTRIRMRVSLGGEPARSLDLDELAYLAGGPIRVVEACIARLIDSEALRSNRRGTVQVVGTPTAINPVDRAVLADAGSYRSRTLTLLIPSASRSAAVEAVGTRLTELDLLIPPAVAKARLRMGIVPLLLLFAIGVVRWVNGIAIGAPVGWLTLQLVLTAVLAVLLVRTSKIQRTAKGNRVLENARSGGSTGGGATSPAVPPLLAGAAGLVALGGLSAHPDLALRTALVAQTYSAGGGVSAGSSSSGHTCSGGSSGSSCSSGGSSCGGGGGGGCGGGGGG